MRRFWGFWALQNMGKAEKNMGKLFGYENSYFATEITEDTEIF